MIGLLEDDSTSGAARSITDQPGPQNLVVADWGAASRQGSQRLRNEDSWGQVGPVFVVADGMGGLDAGDQASQMATRTLISQWFDGESRNPIEVARFVNERVRQVTAEHDSGGTTLSALRIAHDQATILHIGDSRIYRVRDGRAEQMTRDHNLRAELLSAGIVPKSAQNLGPLRALTSFLGMPHEDLHVDVRSIALRDGDVLVLCTDGVFDAMTQPAFASVVFGAEGRSAAELARDLTDDLALGARPDDATAIVMKIGTAQIETNFGTTKGHS